MVIHIKGDQCVTNSDGELLIVTSALPLKFFVIFNIHSVIPTHEMFTTLSFEIYIDKLYNIKKMKDSCVHYESHYIQLYSKLKLNSICCLHS